MPFNYNCNCVVYTGTHDNSTALGWFKTAGPEDLKRVLDFLGIENCAKGNWAFIRCALAGVANTAIIPCRIILILMNTLTTLGGDNWRWRMLPEAATPHLAEKIHRLTLLCGR